MYRVASICTLIAALLVGGLSLIHPPTFDPRAVEAAIEEIVHLPSWSLIHWGLAVSVVFLAVGLTSLHYGLKVSASPFEGGGSRDTPSRESAAEPSQAGSWKDDMLGYSTLALVIALLGIAVLLSALTDEAAGGPLLGRAFVLGANNPETVAVLGVLWASYLARAYVAATMLSTSIVIWSLIILRWRTIPWPRWFAWLGLGGGLLMAAAQPVSWMYPDAALMLQLPGATVLMAWLIALSHYMWHEPPRQ